MFVIKGNFLIFFKFRLLNIHLCHWIFINNKQHLLSKGISGQFARLGCMFALKAPSEVSLKFTIQIISLELPQNIGAKTFRKNNIPFYIKLYKDTIQY